MERVDQTMIKRRRARIYSCPGCGRDTYHYLHSQDFEASNVICLSCGTTHAAGRDEFEYYERRLMGGEEGDCYV